MQIFNRLGNKVFEAFQLTDKWNGIYNNSNASQDSYVFICEFKEKRNNENNKRHIFTFKMTIYSYLNASIGFNFDALKAG